jgi:HAD superfamily hydrolase (TIGR01509 family)
MTKDIHELPEPTAVIFDLDGTLVDTVEARIDAWEQTFQEVGIKATRETLIPLIGLDGRRLAKEVAALDGQPIDDHRAEEIDKRSGEIYERLNRPKPLPGVRELIDTIHAHRLKWAIATSSRKEQVTGSVQSLPLDEEPLIVDASHVKHAKPEPDLLLEAADQLQVDPGRCWYIGDSTWDMVAAVAAGMIAIGVTAGSALDAQALKGAGAATVVETLTDVAEGIRR